MRRLRRHAGIAMMSALDFGELRFQGMTSAHDRVIHFRSDDEDCVAYFQTGVGRCTGLDVDRTLLDGHTAFLPDSMNAAYAEQGNGAMTQFPLYTGGAYHWGVRGLGNRWEVDDYAVNTADTIHRIWVRPTCDDGTYGPDCAETCECGSGTCDDGRDGDGSCVCDPRFAGTDCSACSDGWSGAACDVAEGANETPLASCTEIHARFPNAASGTYLIDPDGAGVGLAPIEAYCDMTTDGGGWTLILNYSHRAFWADTQTVLDDSLPTAGLGWLGTDENGTAAWGHASNALTAALAPVELRFQGRSASHSRKLHFKTDDATCLDYVTTGTGNCNNVRSVHTLLSEHSTFLPAISNNAVSNAGNGALTEHTFYQNGARHWNVGAAGGSRWDLDDWAGTAHHTLHRVFVRSECPDGFYGPSCTSCPSCVNGTCDDGLFGDGQCDCDVDYAGELCDDCDTDRYGATRDACTCVNGVCDDGIDGGGLCLSCDIGFAGETCEDYLESCDAILTAFPVAEDGVYTIDPDGAGTGVAPFDVYCDMTTDGGGWTMIMASDSKGTTVQLEGDVTPGSGAHLASDRVQALAAFGVSTQVHIRTAGAPETRSITSVPETTGIVNLRNLKFLNANSGIYAPTSPVTEWTGPYAVDASILWHTCVVEPYGTGPSYPAIWWACNNSSGLHLQATTSRWFFSSVTDEDLEVYVR